MSSLKATAESCTESSKTPEGKTPRKVQWIDGNSYTREVVQDSIHVLDEKGLDPDAFNTLTEALERYKRGTPLSRVHYYPPRPTHTPQSFTEIGREFGRETCRSVEDEDAGQLSNTSSPNFHEVQTPSPTYAVPNYYIDPEEISGLPGRDSKRLCDKRAKNLVRKHLRKMYVYPQPHSKHNVKQKRGSCTIKKGKTNYHSDADEYAGSSSREDIESDFADCSAGGGLLSALLGLYDSPSVSSSGRSSPEPPPCHDNEGQENIEMKRTSSDGVICNPSGQYTIKSSLSLPSFDMISRPPQARSAGGVFGPLIASTGNLAGVAAPLHSRLQPNVKHSGFRLRRYSLMNKEAISKPGKAKGRSPCHAPSVLGSESMSPIEQGTNYTYITSSGSSAYGIGSQGSSSREFIDNKDVHNLNTSSGISTPTTEREEWVGLEKRKSRRNKRRKSDIFITRHVSQIIQREEFIMKLTRAMMMFGGPSHRLQLQIQSAARVLDVKLNFLYLPDVVLISFDDNTTGTSHIKLIRQASSLDLGKLTDAYKLYWKVIHDNLSVSEASTELDVLMRKQPAYKWWQLILIGGLCSATICTISFAGSFIDALISFPLGALLVAIQLLSVRNVLYSYVFEITITTLFSFLAAVFASTHKVCYSAVASSSIVLILPGFIVLVGSLELMSRNLVSGSVRLCYAIVYALFLGFGLAIGAECYEIFTRKKLFGTEDYTCSSSHDPSGPWYQRTPSAIWAFLSVPLFSLFLSMRNQTPWNRKEMPLLVSISCIGWVANHFAAMKFVGQSDIIAALGAFTVGIVANVYARLFSGNAFVIMITGILFQVPSGLGSGGLLSYASEQASGSANSYISAFATALKLVSVAIGLTVGLGISLALAYPIQSKKRQGAIFSL